MHQDLLTLNDFEFRILNLFRDNPNGEITKGGILILLDKEPGLFNKTMDTIEYLINRGFLSARYIGGVLHAKIKPEFIKSSCSRTIDDIWEGPKWL